MDSTFEQDATRAPVRIRKKPVTIEAMRFDGSNDCAARIIDWVLANGGTVRYEGGHHVAVDTPEGVMRADAGWWVARGVKGKFYPIKPSVVDSTYEDDSAPAPDGEADGGPGSFWTQAEWAEWSNRLAELIPEDQVGLIGNPDGSQESIIESAMRVYPEYVDRLREERSRLRDACVRLAAPLGWATSGTTSSAIHHITSYVRHLEEQLASGVPAELELHAPGITEVSQRLADYPLLRFFAYGHLPADLQRVSAPFAILAFDTVRATERNPETTVALRRLLEAKDAAVRAKVAELTDGRPSTAAADFSTWFPPVGDSDPRAH